jgi:hypothetical protein
MTLWHDDRHELVKFARWLYHRQDLRYGPDMLDFFDDPLAWIRTRLAGDLRAQYEAEQEES